jgi:4-amino-4-deoxy-L-arabinose transferase-like glycosyltransferase
LRLLSSQLAGQISWLLPLAILGTIVGLSRVGLARPAAARRQGLILWGMWLLTGATFFSVANMFHPYYMVTLAPAIAALAGIGLVALWDEYRRPGLWGWLLPGGLVATALLQVAILAAYPAWSGKLTPLVLGLSTATSLVLIVARRHPRLRWSPTARVATAIGTLALVLAPTVWATIPVVEASSRGSSMPSAGPSVFDDRDPGLASRATGSTRAAGGGPFSADFLPTSDPRLLAYLEANRGTAQYLLATPNAMLAAPFILATGQPVMALGGFAGADPILTADQLAARVQQGDVRFFLVPSGRGAGFGFRTDSDGSQSNLTSWIVDQCTLVPNGTWQSTPNGSGMTQLYDCRGVTPPRGGGQ